MKEWTAGLNLCLVCPIESVLADQDLLLQYSCSSEKRLRSDQQPAKPAFTRRPPNRFSTLLQRRNQEAEEDGKDTCSRWCHRDSNFDTHTHIHVCCSGICKVEIYSCYLFWLSSVWVWNYCLWAFLKAPFLLQRPPEATKHLSFALGSVEIYRLIVNTPLKVSEQQSAAVEASLLLL